MNKRNKRNYNVSTSIIRSFITIKNDARQDEVGRRKLFVDSTIRWNLKAHRSYRKKSAAF